VLTSCSAGTAGDAGCEKMLWAAVQRLTREQLGDAIAAMCTALQDQARTPVRLPSITCSKAVGQHDELVLRVLRGFAMARVASWSTAAQWCRRFTRYGAGQLDAPKSCVAVDVPRFNDGDAAAAQGVVEAPCDEELTDTELREAWFKLIEAAHRGQVTPGAFSTGQLQAPRPYPWRQAAGGAACMSCPEAAAVLSMWVRSTE